MPATPFPQPVKDRKMILVSDIYNDVLALEFNSFLDNEVPLESRAFEVLKPPMVCLLVLHEG